jgi:SAM-dependent methyltransferase
LPFGYSVWAKVGIFRYGSNENAEYAYLVFNRHFGLAHPKPGFVALELGPGDALGSAILTRAFGGSCSYQVDVGDFASRDVRVYRRIAEYCDRKDLPAPDLSDSLTLQDVLSCCGATYKTDGLNSLREIADGSVDFIYSQSCLQHVRANEFLGTMRELKRILRPGGTASHWINLQDHLDHALNNLRFSQRIWESSLMAKSGFYTNRIRFAEMRRLAKDAGFVTDVTETVSWQKLPTERAKMATQFRDLPEEDLLVRGFGMVCR